MTNEDLLQQVLNSTIERMGNKAISYEAEIANLTSQIVVLNNKLEEINHAVNESQDS
ncbi:MAG: hypothetical protein WAO41_04705 [Candidatus Nanopelagicales bacterium]